MLHVRTTRRRAQQHEANDREQAGGPEGPPLARQRDDDAEHESAEPLRDVEEEGERGYGLTALAFGVSALNASTGLCLGCKAYLLIRRLQPA